MPKQRLTCTRCSQRRQKCDRKTPCSRCIQNKEAHLCTTHWAEGYNPSVHRRYPKKPFSTAEQSAAGSSDTSSTLDRSPSAFTVAKDNSSNSNTDSTDPLIGPVFTIGQSRFVDITIGSLLNEKDAPAPDPKLFDLGLKYVQSTGKQTDEPNRITSFCSPAAKDLEAQHIQSLLPDQETVMKIIDYYYENMLYWIGGIYHGPTFRRQLVEAYGTSCTLDLQRLDWRWTALLYAILSSSLIASPESLSFFWGYSTDDKVRLSRDWGAASVASLNLGNYSSQYHIYSVQAVYVLHAYAHLVGSTNQWIALRSVAVVIAKGLGLHRLGPHPDDKKVSTLSAQQKQTYIDREIGRRTWAMIAFQEWLCSTSQGSCNGTIQKKHFTSLRPTNLDEETMLPMDDDAPTFTLVSRYFYDYSSLLLDFRNAMLGAADSDDATRYAMILEFDGELRATYIETVPKSLSPCTPLNPTWPKWAKWARTLHQASANHKTIMLHQSFLSKSFKEVRYTYTRWACATAAKNIINLYTTRDPDEPQWWVEQAFVVTSGICLILDMFHRPNSDAEATEYQAYVQRAIRHLQQFFTSSVAVHGIRLLLSLLQEYNKLQEGSRPQTVPTNLCSCVPTNLTDIQIADAARQTHDQTPPSNTDVPLSNSEAAQFNFDIDTIAFEDLMDYLPTEGALDNNVFFDSIYGLTTGQFP